MRDRAVKDPEVGTLGYLIRRLNRLQQASLRLVTAQKKRKEKEAKDRGKDRDRRGRGGRGRGRGTLD